jgi:folylpolyglutamate synthase/dihydropteroate synthase
MGDKDLPGMAAELVRMDPVSVTFVKGGDPRYADFEALRRAWGRPAAEGIGLAEAAARLRPVGDGITLVTGSLYLLGDLLAELGLDPAEAAPAS